MKYFLSKLRNADITQTSIFLIAISLTGFMLVSSLSLLIDIVVKLIGCG